MRNAHFGLTMAAAMAHSAPHQMARDRPRTGACGVLHLGVLRSVARSSGAKNSARRAATR